MVLEITSLIDLLMLGIRIAPEAREKKQGSALYSTTKPFKIDPNRAEGARKNGVLHCIACQKPFKSILKLRRRHAKKITSQIIITTNQNP